MVFELGLILSLNLSKFVTAYSFGLSGIKKVRDSIWADLRVKK